ncbi:hypothetical protein Lser_V15G33665 [Lactuca serriola]
MAKEIATLDHTYSSLLKKMAEEEVKSFGNVDKLLAVLKGLVLKSRFVSSLLISPELLYEMFKMLESTIQKELAPLAKVINLMPTDSPPIHTWVQGGEGISVGIGESSKVSTRGSGSGKTDEDAKVVGKILTTQIPSSLPKTSAIKSTSTTTTTTTTKSITKGIAIGSAGGEILKGTNFLMLQLTSTEDYLIGFAHIKLFIDNYNENLALTNVELALAIGKEITVPQSSLKSKSDLKPYVDVEIFLKPLGIVFVGKNKKENNTKFWFQACDVERHTTTHYTNLIVCMNSCKNNNESDKVEIKKSMNWYSEIRRVIRQVGQMLLT